MGQSVRPSKIDWTKTVSTAKKWQSGFVTNGRMAWNRASSSSVNPLTEADALEARRANWSNFTEAANKVPRSPGEMGVKFSSTRSPHPRHSRSGAMLVKTESSSALLVSIRKTISAMRIFAWKARPCRPMCASLKAKYWQSRRLRRASLQKAHAMFGGSHANSVSDGTTRFHSLFSVRFPRLATDSCAMRTAWNTSFAWGHSALGSTQAQSCLSSILVGCAVDAIDAQLGLGTGLHPQVEPFVALKTRGAARYPKRPAHDEYCHGT